MMIAVWLAAGFATIATGLHLASILAAIGRCRQFPPIKPPPDGAPGVSVIRPVCGIENHIEGDAAFRIPAGLSALRNHLLRGSRQRSRAASRQAPDGIASARAGAAARRQ
jgi:hypothetical protein